MYCRFQDVVARGARQTRIPKRACTLCDRRHSGLCDQSTTRSSCLSKKKGHQTGWPKLEEKSISAELSAI
jgi:hypothetical protein